MVIIDSVAVLILALPLAWFTSMFLLLFCGIRFPQFSERAFAFWMQMPLKQLIAEQDILEYPVEGDLFGDDFSWSERTPMAPERIMRRAAVVEQNIPKARIVVERFKDDPFMLVLRGWGPLRQVCCIGAWETGDPKLDAI